jgi:hypothetical protein
MASERCASSEWRRIRISGMQEEFIRGVRELHKATRPHVNYVKDFERRDVPIEELFELAESAPADTGSYRSRVLSVQQTGDAAVGVVAEEGYWGTVSFIDYFLLARIDGDWKIVSKLFAHTGGEPPEGI